MAYVEHLNETPEVQQSSSNDAIVVQQLKDQLQSTVITNVFPEDQFRKNFLIVFETMANILSKTLGPYGATTMIDEAKNYSVTKDGFHVLQNLRFANIQQNRIHSTLFSISHQMVTKVGDGSTSAVVAAYKFLKTMLESIAKMDIVVRPKDLNMVIQDVIKEICNIISNKAIRVTDENLLDVVEKIANIATNENKEYTDIITNIYKQLGVNCTINIKNSDTLEDNVLYEDGVYTTEAYLVDKIYHNKADTSITKNCAVLMFDHVLDTDIWGILETAFNKNCYKTSKTLIVIAPSYDQFLMDKMRKDAEEMVRTYSDKAKIPFRIIFLKATNLHKPIYKSMYMDLSSLLGATIYRPDDTKEVIKMVEEYGNKCREAFTNHTEAPDIPTEITDSITEHIGYCELAVMGDKISSFKGFTNKNTALYNSLLHDAETNLKNEEARAIQIDSIDSKVFEARTRFGKISCKSATIEVGGANRLERSINFDAVDDAVKACASAIKYGYNKGCNMAIIEAADIVCNRVKVEMEDGYSEMSSKELMTKSIQYNVANAIKNSFIEVYKSILLNAYKSENYVNDIKNQSIEKGYVPFDLIGETYDEECAKIINSCRTDIEILRGAIAMVAVVLSCNQYISSTLNH